MKLRTFLIVAASVLMVAGSGQAQQRDDRRDDTSGKYFANEFSFDAFGAYRKNFNNFEDAFDHNWRHGDFGGGIGLNYFFTRYVGIGAETFFQEHGAFFNNVSGNLIVRMPLGKSGFAPYIFGGGGHRFNRPEEWTYGGGLGLEYRFTRHVGIFADGRYEWADKTSDNTLVRAGMRFAF